MTTGPMRIVVTVRDGSEHVLELESDAEAAHVFDEVSAGRSRLLRGWLPVVPPAGVARAIIRGEEVVRLRLVAPPVREPADGP